MNTRTSTLRASAAPAAPQAEARFDRVVVVLVILAGVVSALHVGKAPIAMNGVARDFGLGPADLGGMLSVFAVVGLLGSMAAGLLAMRCGDRRALVTGLCILGLASLAGSAAPAYGWLLASRVVEGLGFVLVMVAAPAALNRLTPPARRSVVFGFWSTFMGIGIALSMLLGPMLGGWRLLWRLDAALALLMALWLAWRLPAPPAAAAARPDAWQGARAVLRCWPPLRLALAFAAYNLQFFALMAFLPAFLAQRVGLSEGQAGLASAFVVVANILGNVAAGALLQRGVPAGRLMAAACALTGALGLAVFLPAMPAPAVIPLCTLFSALAGVLPAVLLASAPGAAPAPELAPMSLGLLMQGNYLGQVLAPALAGLLLSAVGWPAVGVQIAVGALLGVVLAGAPGARSR